MSMKSLLKGSLKKELDKAKLNCPTVKILINKTEFKQKGSMFCNYVNVDMSVGPESSTCVVKLIDPNYIKKDKFNINEKFKKIKLGSKIEVSLGYGENIKPVFSGYVYSYSIDVISSAEGNKSMAIVRCMDSKILMMQNKLTNYYNKEKNYSQVVNSIFRRYKLIGSIVKIESEKKFDKEFFLYQRNESDYDFLTRLATETGCLFYADSTGKVSFISPKNASSNKKVSTLEPSIYIFNIKSTQNIFGIPASMEVSAVDSKNPTKAVKSVIKDSKKIGSGGDVSKSSKNIPSKSIISIVDNNMHSVSETKFRAQGEYNLRELNLMETKLKIKGCYYFEIGKKIKLKDFDSITNNEYIITGVTHEYSAETNSYFTWLTLNTNRIKIS